MGSIWLQRRCVAGWYVVQLADSGTDYQVPDYLQGLWETIATTPLLVNDFETFWERYTTVCDTIYRSTSNTPFAYRVTRLLEGSMKGLFDASPSRKNLHDRIPPGSGIQDVCDLDLK
jgi:hypothetical protein